MSNAYIRFLNLVDALERINPARSLDDLETQLLERIMLNQVQNKALLVGDLINLTYLGSQGTLHGRLKSLLAQKYILLIPTKEDARKKSVIPTNLAIKYMQFMSNCMKRSLR